MGANTVAATVECVTCKRMFDPRGIRQHRVTAHGASWSDSGGERTREQPAAAPSTTPAKPAVSSDLKPAAPAGKPAPASPPTSSENAPASDGAKPAARPWWKVFDV